jgi:hypothetical protein
MHLSCPQLTLYDASATAGGPWGFLLNEFLFPFADRWDFPHLKRFIVELIPSQRVQKLKGITDLMYNVSQEIIMKKKRALASSDKAVVRELEQKKDIISILSECIHLILDCHTHLTSY